jgi:ferredoxin
MLFALIPVLVVAGAILGRHAGPFAARAHRTVRLARQISLEEAGETAPGATLESEAFRETDTSPDDLYAQAAAVESRISIGSALMGAWIGLVIGIKLFALSGIPDREEYEIDHSRCVVCARCFMSCPRERLRRKG